MQEQLLLGHIQTSTSPWNTPIFVIKKKLGKWRLLHDLRAINNQMQIMGPVQRGLPLLSAVPRSWPIIVIDIKDCFFSIPLNSQDTPRFAFTVPSLNQEQIDQRYEWRVLPQGMANSPTLCQLYVDAALQPVRNKFSQLRCLHYMDDILLACEEEEILDRAYCMLIKALEEKNLVIASEKVQKGTVIQFLGNVLYPHFVMPQRSPFVQINYTP